MKLPRLRRPHISFSPLSIKTVIAAISMACASMAAVFLVPQIIPEDKNPSVRYTALGDSYSAGTGASLPGKDEGACHRTGHAFPDLWAVKHLPASFTNLACSGATTNDVMNQVGAMASDTTLVTVTVGGNDASFAAVVSACTMGIECYEQVAESKLFLYSQLGQSLDNVYKAIRSKAPKARVIVMGYPNLFEENDICVGGPPLIARTSMNSLNTALSAVTAEAVHRAGKKFAYVDAREAFTRHGVCSSDTWINPVTIPFLASYHPNAAGQQLGYLPLLEKALEAK